MPAILLVDPATADAALLASALRLEGFDVLVRATAAEAHEALAEHPIVLTILELVVRNHCGSSGLALARELRATYPTTRIVLTSAYHLNERQLERAGGNVSGFIPKPYDLREVVEFVSAKALAPPSSRRLWPSEPASGVSRTAAAAGPASGVSRAAPAEPASAASPAAAAEPRRRIG